MQIYETTTRAGGGFSVRSFAKSYLRFAAFFAVFFGAAFFAAAFLGAAFFFAAGMILVLKITQ